MAVHSGCLMMQLRAVLVFCLVYSLRTDGYLVNFQPGTSYSYDYEATTQLQNAGIIETKASISIHWLEDTKEGQHCRLTVKNIIYQLAHEKQGAVGEYSSSNDFSNWFSFVMSRHGEILSVFYEEDETEEIILLKKILLGTLSAKLHATEGALAKGAPWSYRVNETGHEGNHESTYSVHKVDGGLKFQKTKHGHVVANADASHNKDIVYDNTLQAPHTITIKEHFTAPKKAPQGFDGHAGLPGDNAKHREQSEEADFELPDMHGHSHGSLRFTGQSQHTDFNDKVPVDLVKDTLKIESVPLPKYNLLAVEEHIISNMTCMRVHHSAMAPEKSTCFHNLVEMVSRLPPENITYLADTYIRPEAMTLDEMRNKEIMIDAFGATKTETTQTLLTELVLNAKPRNASLIMRTLVHFVKLKNPPPEVFVDALEELATYGKVQFADPDDTWLVHNRATLVLGSVASDLQRSKKKSVRERGEAILRYIEDLLEVHDPWHHRQIRSTMSEDDYMEHITWKATLMQSLGNAASPSSYHHILSYMNHSDGHPLLRRSGIYAMGKYKTPEASSALLSRALEDDDENVRYVAALQYTRHPHADESINLGSPFPNSGAFNNSSSEPRSRRRRNIFDGIQFNLATPEVDWRKNVGSKDIGAKLGLVMKNEFDLDIKPLEGSVKIDIYDHAYGKGILGFVGVSVTFAEAKVCFRGEGSYSVNILQEFGFSDIKTLVNFFDEVVGKIVDSVKNAIKAFKNLMSPSHGNALEDVFNSFVDAVKKLPSKVKNVRKFGKDVFRRIGKYSGLPDFFKDVENVVERVSALLNAVKTDVMELYNSINDAATITIPWVGEQLQDAIPTIAGALKKLFKSPKAAIDDVSRFILQIKGAVAVVIDAKKRIEDACFFTEGNEPYWFDMKTELEGIWEDIQKARDSLAEAVSWVTEGADADDELLYYTGISKEEFRRRILQDITGALDVFNEPLNELENLAKPFVEAYDAVFGLIESVKEGYEGLKLGYEYAKSLLNKIFGSKSALDFPRKFAETSCGEGFYPSTIGGTPPGVDLEIETGATLVSPFTGEVSRSGENQVTIKISDEIKDTEVIIDNIDLDDDKDDRLIFKNMKLGTVVSSGCSPNSIHLSMRKIDTEDYIDPTRYIEKRKILEPGWTQHCDEYYIDILTDATISGPGRISKGPQDTDESPQRTSEPDTSDVDDIIDDRSRRRNRDGKSNEWGAGFLGLLGFPKLDDRGPLFNFRLSSLRLGDIFGFLDAAGQSSIRIQLENLLDSVQLKLGSLAWDFARPETLSDDELRTALKARLKPIENASRTTMIKLYREMEMRCTDLQNFLPKNSFCWFDEDCLGVECNVEQTVFNFPINVKAYARLDPCQLQFNVGFNDWSREFDLEELLSDGPFEDSIQMEGNFELFDFLELSFRYRIERSGFKVQFDLEATVCSTKVIDRCFPPLKVFKDLSFEMIPCDSSSTGSSRKRRSVLSLDDIPLESFEELLDIVDLDQETVGNLMKDIMETVKNVAIDSILTKLKEKFENEFMNFDLKIAGGKVFGPYNIDFIEPQWHQFALGPIPMMFGYGAAGSLSIDFTTEAAILSMSLTLKVRPEMGASVWGSLAIGIPMFYAELRLTGYLMTTGFPTQAQLQFDSFPIDVDARMDLVLIPLKLELRARLVFELKLLFKTIKSVLINVRLWGYTSPQINKNIFNKGELEPDTTPPTFRKISIPKNELEEDLERALAPITHCNVYQVVGRDHVEPAFQLSIAVDDDRSEVDMTFCVGTYKSGCDVLKDQTMGGSSVIVSAILPGGIPLYYTIKATNSAKAVAMATCYIPTYDRTLPGGRITPDFKSTSRPNVLRASAVVHDDSILIDQKEGVGFGLGLHGDQTVPWNDISLRAVDPGIIQAKTSPLDHFTAERKGRLNSRPHGVKSFNSAYRCAEYCLGFPPTKCISFNYDFGNSELCEPLEEIEGYEVDLHESGFFHYFERLGVGHTVQFNHEDLQLRHADTHYFNMYIENSLGYESVISSKVVVVDFEPPEPGPIEAASYDQKTHESCIDFVPDEWENRCIEETPLDNHRYIIDGPGSKTVFNGHEPLVDLLYTRANAYVSANWDGFHDDETGIFGYTWTVGTEPCLDNIHPHKDPHSHLFDESEWTHIGIAYPLPVPYLPDGRYHVTVRALNKVELGGPLATTVCHTIPYTIDNTPPIVHEVFNVHYDDTDCTIRTEYNVSDDLSNIREVDFGLGRSSRDVYIMDWLRESNITHIALQFCIPDGIPAWIKIRAINNVDLRTVGYAPSPLIVDSSPPIAGEVFDGTVHDHDIDFQSEGDVICVSWHNFYDQESGIQKYVWFVGTSPGDNDTVPNMELSHTEYRACSDDVVLTHNVTYYSTIIAFNAGHRNLQTSVTTDGVLYDATPPESGWIKDGLNPDEDMVFSSEPSTVSANWDGFSDPESNIKEYSVTVWRKHADTGNATYPTTIIHDAESVSSSSNFINWHHFHLHEGDFVYVELEAINNALGGTDVSSDGFTIDITEPILYFLGDGSTPGIDRRFTASTNQLSANWEFQDFESGIDHYKLSVYETFGGTRRQIYPFGEPYETLGKTSTIWTSTEELSLKTGGHYEVRVSAVNGAGLTNVQDTNGVIVDPSPPVMRALSLGILSPGAEELFDGYVIDTDTAGIKAYWKGTDFESGIDGYFVAVGMHPGGTDVLDFTNFGPSSGGYIGDITLDLYDESNDGPVYYVTVKAQNGAGTFSDPKTSSPLKLVSGDKIGFVIDGPDEVDTGNKESEVDVDYQLESGTITAQFHGFESAQHGIVHYEWAVGRSPLADDVQPYISAGIVLPEDEGDIVGEGVHGFGKAQALLPLEPGIPYFTTVRAITGAGNVLETTSDGFTVDITPPSIDINKLEVPININNNKAIDFVTSTGFYQKAVESLSASWTVEEEESEVAFTEFCYGTYPGASDVYNCTETTGFDYLPSALVQPNANTPNILTLITTNQVGLREEATSESVMVDTTPPVAGQVTCSPYVRSGHSLKCSWSDFQDKESGIAYYEFAVGMSEGEHSVFPFVLLESSRSEYEAKDFIGGALRAGSYYVTISATNRVGDSAKAYSKQIIVDETPPVAGKVVELTGIDEIHFDNGEYGTLGSQNCITNEDCSSVDAVCQSNTEQILVSWQPFQDPDTPVVRYQLAVGTSPGGTQLRDFYDLENTDGFVALIRNIDLYDVRRAYVSVRGYNAAGLSATATSNGVFISRVSAGLPAIGSNYVWDGTKDRDLDYQDNNEELSGQWNFEGDPCPITKYEWAIMRFDGIVVQPMLELPKGLTHGVNDELNMKDGESFYLVVRATNELGFTYSLRSNGVTIQKEPLLPGHVRDGDVIGYDLNYQASITSLSANWDDFGMDTLQKIGEDGDHQIIDYYEVAAGTDRRYPNTRDDVHPFVNVGLNTSHTFYDLNLVPRKLTYFVTVRAYSKSTATAQITSNGIQVGYGGTVVSTGKISIPRYIASTSSMSVSWAKFEFGMPILLYQWGISSERDVWSTMSCFDMQHFNQKGEVEGNHLFTHLFDGHPLTNGGKDTMVTLSNLKLQDKETYTFVVIATDESAQCSLLTAEVTVDLTPPVEGKLRIGEFDEQLVTYSDRDDLLVVRWDGYYDDESGIKAYTLSIYDGVSCSGGSDPIALQEDIQVLANDTEYTFVDLTLQADRPYYVHLSCINKADLVTTTISRPILLDLNDPIQGVVKDGTVFSDDVEYQSTTEKLEGVFLHLPNPSGSPCPSRQFTFTGDVVGDDFGSVNSEGLWGIPQSSLWFRPKQLSFDEDNDLSVTLIRDVQRPRMYSGAYYSTNPDVHEGGKYQIDILAAASGDVPAVTSVVFWDGPTGVVGEFDAPIGETKWADMNREYDLCKLCCEKNDSYVDQGKAECRCNCTEYFMRTESPTTQAPTTTTMATTEALATTSSPLPWEIVEDDDPDDTFKGGKELKSMSYQSMGLQLHPGVESDGDVKHYAVLWFRYQNSSESVKYEIIQLDFDPSAAWHSYAIDVIPDKAELSVELHVDGRSKIYMSGLALFGTDTKFVMSVWNRHGIVPEFDNVFYPPIAIGHFRNLRFPPTSEALCRFGDPFRNGDVAITAFFAGVGSSKLVDDVVPFREVVRPCTPCSKPCDILDCDSSCSSTEVTEYKVVLDGLNLSPTRTQQRNGESETSAAVYHLTVKAVTGSGRHIIASSDGVYVDDTPPEFDYLYHVDLDWSEDEPVEYQGSNTTIAVRFSAFDIGSQIHEFRWSIGTQPLGTDIQESLSVGFDTLLINDGLSLKDRQTYFVTVEAINRAGLVTTLTTTGVTIITTAPDTSASNTTTECGDVESLGDMNLCSDQSSVGMTWTRIEDDSVDAYYFQIGSTSDSQDIFPKLRVGYNTSGTILIKDGRVYIEDIPIANISGVRQIAEGEAGTAKHDQTEFPNRFRMEPGRIVYSELIACNRGHKCGKVSTSKSTPKREKDVLATAINGSKVIITMESPSSGSGVSPFVEIETEEDVDVVITKREAEKEAGGSLTLMAGLLTDSDLAEYYGSDASPFFKAYIVDPKTTKDSTDRLLRNRIKDIAGPTFYLTNVGDKSISAPIRISLRFNTSLFNVSDVERYPVIMFWHTDLQQWQDASQTCKGKEGKYDIDWDNEVISVEVCATDAQKNHLSIKSKRAVNQGYFAGPSEFTFASIGSFTNSPPQITSTNNIWLNEDGGTLRFQMTAYDDDGDEFVFKLNENLNQPQLGSVSLSENGELTYRPCLDCFGTDYVHYVVTEDRDDNSDLLSTFATLEVEVREKNDNPEIFLSVDHVSALEVSEHEVAVTLEERKEHENVTTYKGFEAVVGAFDPDTYDQLTISFYLPKHGYLYTGPQHNDVSFIYQDCSNLDNVTEDHLSYDKPDIPAVVFPCGLHFPHGVDRLAWVFSALRYVPDEGYFGEDSFKINVIDQEKYHSEVIVVHLHILANPCLNDAVCLGPAFDPGCTTTRRSQGFGDYTCKCKPGYVGDYCDIDFNECDDNPCDFNYTCIDMVGAFVCHCENPKWPCGGERFPVKIAVSVCVVVTVLTVIAIIVWRRIKAKKKAKVAPETDDMKNVYKYEVWSNEAFDMSESTSDLNPTNVPMKQDDKVWVNEHVFDPEFDSKHVFEDTDREEIVATPVENLTSTSDEETPVKKDCNENEGNEVNQPDLDAVETQKLVTVFSVPSRFGFVGRPNAPVQAWGKWEPNERKGSGKPTRVGDIKDEEESNV
ncbi:uncharacterized protein [Ptychodera flava]|uniref:uncharacterized protein n=1 Tax=Ptychodera flava TaxID=63121 RepID=UPI00396A54DF